jgi:hypothetical protein
MTDLSGNKPDRPRTKRMGNKTDRQRTTRIGAAKCARKVCKNSRGVKIHKGKSGCRDILKSGPHRKYCKLEVGSVQETHHRNTASREVQPKPQPRRMQTRSAVARGEVEEEEEGSIKGQPQIRNWLKASSTESK